MRKSERDYDKLTRVPEELRFKEAAFLREQGWKETCDTPGSLWLWETQYKGRTILVPQDIAMDMEGHFLSGVYRR